MSRITIDLDEKDARVIYINLRNHFVIHDDQRVVYDFVHLLDKLIDEALMTRQDVKGKLGI
jgi:hypothetical protein